MIWGCSPVPALLPLFKTLTGSLGTLRVGAFCLLGVQFLLEDSAPFVDASLDCSHWDAEDVRYLLVGVAECVHDDRTDADASC